MKKSCLAVICGLCVSSMAMADSELSFQTEISPQVVNSKAVDNGLFTDVDKIKVAEGKNQIGVTVGQIVFEDGKKRKYDSDLMLVTFDTKDEEQYQLSYKKFRTIEEAQKFASDPELQLTDSSGNQVSFKLAVLAKNGLQGFRDYEREVADFNKEHGYSEVTVNENSVTYSSVDEGLVKEQFSIMSREEQQDFMQWAMKNLK